MPCGLAQFDGVRATERNCWLVKGAPKENARANSAKDGSLVRPMAVLGVFGLIGMDFIPRN
jgi:hypothetical protein